MNIRSSQQRPFTQVNPTGQHNPSPQLASASANAAGDVQSTSQGTSAGEGSRGRLGGVASDLQDRVAFLLESGGLSDAEHAAVSQAGADFQALVDRMDNAMSEGGLEQDGKLQRAFGFAVDQLRNDVRTALSGSEAPDRSNSKDIPKTIADKVGSAGGGGQDSADVLARLSNSLDSVESRLAGLAKERGRDGGAEIMRLQETFGEVFTRLESAVEGGMNPSMLGDLFERMMNSLRNDIGGAESEGPMLYDSKSSVTSLSASQAVRRLDATG